MSEKEINRKDIFSSSASASVPNFGKIPLDSDEEIESIQNRSNFSLIGRINQYLPRVNTSKDELRQNDSSTPQKYSDKINQRPSYLYNRKVPDSERSFGNLVVEMHTAHSSPQLKSQQDNTRNSFQVTKNHSVGRMSVTASMLDGIQRELGHFPSISLIDPRQKSARVTVKWKDVSINTQIILCWTITEAMNEILMDFSLKTNDDFVNLNISRFMVGKVDRKFPGIQTWMNAENYLYSYDIMDGVKYIY